VYSTLSILLSIKKDGLSTYACILFCYINFCCRRSYPPFVFTFFCIIFCFDQVLIIHLPRMPRVVALAAHLLVLPAIGNTHTHNLYDIFLSIATSNNPSSMNHPQRIISHLNGYYYRADFAI
jgi:hypothetical protein